MKNKGEKKILFLDFDGVLNSIGFFLSTEKTVDMFLDVKTTFRSNMDIHNVKLLNYILDQVPELQIIISSSWGKRYTLPEIRKGLKYVGLKKEYAKRIISITPKKMSSWRCHEVKWAVDDLVEEGWTVDKWLTLDDNPIFPESKDRKHFGAFRSGLSNFGKLSSLSVKPNPISVTLEIRSLTSMGLDFLGKITFTFVLMVSIILRSSR